MATSLFIELLALFLSCKDPSNRKSITKKAVKPPMKYQTCFPNSYLYMRYRWGLATDQLHASEVCMECMMSHPIALLQHVKYCSEWLNW